MPELKSKLRCGACGSELKRTHEHEKNGIGLSYQYGACLIHCQEVRFGGIRMFKSGYLTVEAINEECIFCQKQYSTKLINSKNSSKQICFCSEECLQAFEENKIPIFQSEFGNGTIYAIDDAELPFVEQASFPYYKAIYSKTMILELISHYKKLKELTKGQKKV